MSGPVLNGPFDIPEMTDRIPRRVKPWIFVLWVIIIQFSGGLYLAAATDMVGDKALMQQDILMAGYAQLVGMSINFCVMFRLKFRFSARTGFIMCLTAMMACSALCTITESVALMVAASFIAGWFRMWATFLCNSTIQLWLTPIRRMSIFFCFVYIVVDGTIQLSGIATVYLSFFTAWEYMSWLMIGLLALTLLSMLMLLKPQRCPMFIPLLGIDWLGSLLWSVAMIAFVFVCVYGNHYDWWESSEIWYATWICAACVALNLWRASFLRHPYVSFMAMTNSNVVKASLLYLAFFTLLGTEHVLEATYAGAALGFDSTNMIDLNWYVFAGIVVGVGLTYWLFCMRRWRYKSMVSISFGCLALYLGWFYFMTDYNVEKEMLFGPLFIRGVGSVMISIVLLTSIVQSGLPFMVFPQALVINGFMGAVCGAALGPAVIGELFSRITARNFALLSSGVTDTSMTRMFPPDGIAAKFGDIFGMTRLQAMMVSIKEIYGLLLILCILCIVVIALSYSRMRPWAIFPKWRTIRRVLRHESRDSQEVPA